MPLGDPLQPDMETWGDAFPHPPASPSSLEFPAGTHRSHITAVGRQSPSSKENEMPCGVRGWGPGAHCGGSLGVSRDARTLHGERRRPVSVPNPKA